MEGKEAKQRAKGQKDGRGCAGKRCVCVTRWRGEAGRAAERESHPDPNS